VTCVLVRLRAARFVGTGDPASRVLELGCGTGRVAIPVAKAGATVFGIDRSASMLIAAGQSPARRALARTCKLIRGDIRHLPFPDQSFPVVMAPYGILQSLLDEKLLAATLERCSPRADARWHVRPELVADSAGVGGVFEQSHAARRARAARQTDQVDRDGEAGSQETHHALRADLCGGSRPLGNAQTFSLGFRTLSVPQMVQRLEQAASSFHRSWAITRAVPWDLRADVWIILARRG
jgi:SAM-dependent methyltransferase